MVTLDFFIEVNAPLFDFWYWDIGYPPLRNFIDWFIISVIMQTILQEELHREKHPFPIHHFASQLLFFAFFYVIYTF
jgi:putative membrane protein